MTISQSNSRSNLGGDRILNARIRELGLELWKATQGEVPGIFNKDFWQGRILEWAMKDPGFRVDLFRLVDVMPALKTRRQVIDHLREYLLVPGRELPLALNAALKAASAGPTGWLAVDLIRRNISNMAENFIVGTDAAQAIPVLRSLHHEGIGFTADLLGEAALSPEEAEVYRQRYLHLIDALADETLRWKKDEVLQRGANGPLPLANISLKLSALDSQLDPVDAAGGVARLKEKLLPLFHRAKKEGVFLNIDLEQWQLHGITYDFFEEILSDPDLRTWPHLGIVVQAYLKDSQRDVERLLSLAKHRGAPITVRLVKGAYWDYEVSLSRQTGLPCPVFTNKSATDANYESLSRLLLQNAEHLPPAFGSHNLRSLSHALAQAEALQVPPQAFEIQMLFGMAEPERKVLRRRGYRMRVYAPVGELLPGMAYLVRRLLENTSNSGFLRLSYREGENMEKLLDAPRPQAAPLAHREPGRVSATAPYENCPFSDFTDQRVRQAFAAEIERTGKQIPFTVPVVVSGHADITHDFMDIAAPHDPRIIVSRMHKADAETVNRAVEIAYKAYPAWRDTSLTERAALLERLAEILTTRRVEFAALQTWEAAKPRREADGDVAEAIDFCCYYARQALTELGPQKQTHITGEENTFLYQGRGPTAVIAPWNFPLAILTGMTTAALVAGNPVLLKPAEQSSAMAWFLFQCLLDAGASPDVVHFLPGLGEEVGARLVEHPLIAQIAFTGSMAVGLKILEAAARVRPGQPQLKRVVCEMGGKNAIIIDDDADLDEAVTGVVHSAFGYAGQKCSACSRVLTVGAIHEDFIRRLVRRTAALRLAPAIDPACDVPPVIDAESFARLKAVKTNPGAKTLYSGADPQGGHFLAPAIYEVTDARHPLMQDELFGPILAVMPVSTFEEALQVASSVPYALTGAVYSRSPIHLDAAREKFQVGNLYLNRPSTGALVGRQPFGGFNMSGLGAKAGGPGYLLQFADPRAITENTMRRGFSPEVST